MGNRGELGTFTWLDVLTNNGHMGIPVGTCMFMPEANDVTQLMHDNAEFVTVFPNGDGLRSPTSAPHIGTAPVWRVKEHHTKCIACKWMKEAP